MVTVCHNIHKKKIHSKMNALSFEDQLAQITLEDKDEETYEERLARSTAVERFNVFEVQKPRQCLNLSDYKRDDIDREIEIWKFDRYYPTHGLLGGTDDASLNFSNEARRQCTLIIDVGYSVHHQSLALKEILIHDGVITQVYVQ
jgi:hypothetical protein